MDLSKITFRELLAQDSLSLAGQAVEFTAKIEEVECDIEEGVIANIVSINDRGDDGLQLVVDVESYRAHNETVAKPCYYDDNGKPTLTVHKTIFYKPVTDFYLMLDDVVGDYLKLRGNLGRLFPIYRAKIEAGELDQSLTYVGWLEQIAAEALQLT